MGTVPALSTGLKHNAKFIAKTKMITKRSFSESYQNLAQRGCQLFTFSHHAPYLPYME